MPEGPDQSGKDGGSRQAASLGELRHQKSAPSDFFPKGCGGVSDHTNSRGKEEVQNDGRPWAHRTQSEIFGNTLHELSVVKAADTRQPNKTVRHRSVGKWKEVSNHLVAGFAPTPTESGQVPMKNLASDQRRHSGTPHQAA